MISSIGGSSSGASALFSKLDTKNQGYIEKSDLQSAFAGITESGGSDSAEVDQVFKQLDADGDDKVTENEMSAALTKMAEQLNTQFDQSRVKAGMAHMQGGGQGAMPPPRAMAADEAQSSDDSTYIAAADTNGDGTVSADEAAAYEKLTASEAGATASSAADGLPATFGGMPAAPPNASDAGFSKDELVDQLDEIGSTGSKRAALISKLIENFDQADSDGDGKVDNEEARAFDKSSKTAAADAADTASNEALAMMKMVQLLRAYGSSDEASAFPAISTLSVSA
jgi:Ca2+-binding EF-hand superfamily protein